MLYVRSKLLWIGSVAIGAIIAWSWLYRTPAESLAISRLNLIAPTTTSGEPIREVTLSGSFRRARFEDLLPIRSLAYLESLTIDEVPLRSDCGRAIVGIKDLKRLFLRHNDIDDDFLLRIGSLMELRELEVSYSNNVTEKGLASLRDHQALESGTFFGLGLTDSSLSWLGDPPRLRSFVANGEFLSDATMKRLAALPSLSCLYLADSLVTSDGLVFFENNQRLMELSLPSSGIDDECGQYISSLRELRCLSVAGTKVTDRMLDRFDNLHNLCELSLAGTRITGIGFDKLCKLKELRELILNRTKLDAANLTKLVPNNSLTTLKLENTATTDVDLIAVQQMHVLQTLDLRNCTEIGDEALKIIGGHRSIERLVLNGTGISVSGLRLLGECPKLREIIVDPQLLDTDAGRQLQKAMPAVRAH